MPTIVEYTSQKRAQNRYPDRIISPLHPQKCCFTDTRDLGPEQCDARWVYRYRRCGTCGYTVRLIVRQLLDTALIAELRQHLATSFLRNIPDY